MNKNILICVSGLTPQIVTETLFCLSVKQKIPVHEIYILTTKRGREVILGRDPSPSTPKSPLKNEIEALCKKYKIKKPLFEENDTHIIVAKEESIELFDIRSDKDNILFPNKVCDFIRTKTSSPNTTLFCSITGGRKSMSVHLANALSLFAREQDKLLHVLTKEEHEFKGFFPATKKEADDLELSEIPFVKLRPLLSKEIKSEYLEKMTFDKIVKYTQNQLKVFTDNKNLILDIQRRSLTFGQNSITLEPMEFIFYFYFVDIKLRGKEKISIHEITSPEVANMLLNYIEQYYKYYYLDEKKVRKLKEKGIDAENFRTKRSKINPKLSELINDPDFEKLFIIDVEKIYADSKYFIRADKEKFKIKYLPK